MVSGWEEGTEEGVMEGEGGKQGERERVEEEKTRRGEMTEMKEGS